MMRLHMRQTNAQSMCRASDAAPWVTTSTMRMPPDSRCPRPC